LIVEVDGDIHDLQKEYDLERERYLTARGFRILRFRNKEVEDNLQDVLKKILDTCKVT